MENTRIEEVKEILLKENQNFRELAQQHQNFEKRLSELAELNYPSEEEVLEETALKRKKLAVKDEMYTMMNEYESSHQRVAGVKIYFLKPGYNFPAFFQF